MSNLAANLLTGIHWGGLPFGREDVLRSARVRKFGDAQTSLLGRRIGQAMLWNQFCELDAKKLHFFEHHRWLKLSAVLSSMACG